jgi:hypothetical protein
MAIASDLPPDAPPEAAQLLSPEDANGEAQERVRAWRGRIEDADETYTKWEKQFECKTLREYWEGRQWKGSTEDEASAAYQVNLFYSSIETKLPTLLFYKPDYKVTARPQHLATEGSNAEARAQLCEDALQTVVEDPRTMFRAITGLAMKDAEFRFGIVEVGYSANWIDNPNANRPVLKDDQTPYLNEDTGDPLLEPAKVPAQGSERVYLKRIPPQNFRVSKRPESLLPLHDWSAYFEWAYCEDVKRNPAYINTADLKPSGTAGKRKRNADRDDAQHADMVKLWFIRDHRTKTKTVIAEGHDLPLLEDEPYETFTLCDLKYVDRPDEYYPIPPVFNGRKPQDEVNEIRQRQREHGRRYTRKYTYSEAGMDPEEVEKIEKGGDGTIARRKTANAADAIMPIPDANLHPYTQETLQTASDDFHQVVGVTAEQEGISESDTATQANILNVNSQIRTTSQRVVVADWLAEIGRAMLGVIIEKMQFPMWIRQNVDLQALQPQMMPGMDPRLAMAQTFGAQQRTMETAQQYKEITAQDLGDFLGVDVSVDVGALSPASQAQEAQAWQMVFQWLSNPPTLMAMATSPAILKKLLTAVGLRSASDMAEIQRLAQMLLMSGLAVAGAGAGAPSGEPAGQPAGLPSAPMSLQ